MVNNIHPVVRTWKQPITIARHAYGDIYKATEYRVPEEGKAELVFTNKDGKETFRETIYDFECPGVLLSLIHISSAYSDYRKFDPYLFNTTGLQTHNKEKLFKEWGYTVEDARWLQAEIERQAKERYIAGKYTLGKLNWNGQRIRIRVIIPRRDRAGEVSFITGWMVEPGGKLRMTTPYGGK